MNIEYKHKKLIEKSKEYMKNIHDYEHNMNHVIDVVNYTKELLDILDLKLNKEVCIIAAYWHDVGRTEKSIGHEKLSAQILKNHMLELNYDLQFIDSCCKAIENHKWNMNPTTNEGLVLKDADKLAYLGSERWIECLNNHQKLDSIIQLLPKLKKEILYFDESKNIYDRDIVNLVKLLYMNVVYDS